MAKTVIAYICKECQKSHPKYRTSCAGCGADFSLESHEVERGSSGNRVSSTGGVSSNSGLKSSGAIKPSRSAPSVRSLKSNPISRTPTGISELDRVLGGGFVDAEVVLLAGQPGAGKSSLTLHVAEKYANMGKNVLYSSGEESEQQIGLRAKRFGIDADNIFVINETSLESLQGYIEDVKPELLIVDSLQTIASSEISGSVGSISQSKEAANVLTRIAKTHGISMILVNQIVKSGEFAGSEGIQHIVDCAMMLDSENESPLKFLRATKNRFGDTTEVGVFQHEEKGLMEVPDPSGVFTDNNNDSTLPGSTCCMMTEGVRSMPVEVQALVTKATASFPRRQFNGVDYNRAQIICAVVDKHTKASCAADDVYMTTLSGVKIKDPQSDLALAAALVSSKTGKTMGSDQRVAFIGELGLTGYVRGGYMIENKIAEADRLGFDQVVIPDRKLNNRVNNLNIKITKISHVRELTDLFRHQ